MNYHKDLLLSKAICIILIFWFKSSISSTLRVICVVTNSFSLIKPSNCFFNFSIAESLSCKSQQKWNEQRSICVHFFIVYSPGAFLLIWCSRHEFHAARISNAGERSKLTEFQPSIPASPFRFSQHASAIFSVLLPSRQSALSFSRFELAFAVWEICNW